MPGIHEENPPTDPIPNTKYFVGNVATAFKQNEDFYRAAFMSAEQLGLFDPRILGRLYQQVQQVAAPRKQWHQEGLLLGKISPRTIMKRVHNSNRLGRLDWTRGYIDLNQFRPQVTESILLAYASDASPELRVRLCEEIEYLNSVNNQ